MAATLAARGQAPYNVVLIVADDLGFSDLGSYGGELETPNLDRLARGGVRFTQFYATPRCSPSRAALLTGRYPHSVGVGHLNRDWNDPAYRGAIRADVAVLPERLRAAGYRTYMAGKWHLAPVPREPEERASYRDAWPLQRGFDTFFGPLAGSGSYFQPLTLMEGNEPVAPGEDFYLTDVLGERAAELVAEHSSRQPERPFFLYLAFTAPHWPLQAPAADIERFRGRFDDGWDALRAERLARMKALGIVPPQAELAPRAPGVPLWESAENRAWEARRMEVYAAMVWAMDRAVGRVLGALREAGLEDRTVVVFTSDNGASAESLKGLNRLLPFFVPIPTETPAGDPVRFGDAPDIDPGGPATFAAYGAGWAQLSNTPFRGFKKSTAEGGIAVPLIVRWPGSARRADALVHDPGHIVDLLPTILDLAGLEPDADGETVPPAGRSLRPLLEPVPDEASPPDPEAVRTLFWEHEGNRAVRRGNWKRVARWPLPPRLYDLSVDRGESEDVTAAHPAIAAELDEAWSGWAHTQGVATWPLIVPGVKTAIAVAAILILLLLVRGRVARRGRGGGRGQGTPPRTVETRSPPPRETQPIAPR